MRPIAKEMLQRSSNIRGSNLKVDRSQLASITSWRSEGQRRRNTCWDTSDAETKSSWREERCGMTKSKGACFRVWY